MKRRVPAVTFPELEALTPAELTKMAFNLQELLTQIHPESGLAFSVQHRLSFTLATLRAKNGNGD